MTSDDAKNIADTYVATDSNFKWEFVEVRFVDAKNAGESIGCANKWVVEYKADQGKWNPVSKLVVIDDRTGDCMDWGC